MRLLVRSGWLIASQLGDHRAHRGAGDVGAIDAERVDEADRVVGHVAKRIGNIRRIPRHDLRQERGNVGRAQVGEMS